MPLAWQPVVAVLRVDVRTEARVRLVRVGRLLLDPRSVPLGELGARIDHVAPRPAPDGEEQARPLTRADEHVLRPRRAVDEVPGPQRPLLALDQEQALPGEDEEVLLLVLAVVHAAR